MLGFRRMSDYFSFYGCYFFPTRVGILLLFPFEKYTTLKAIRSTWRIEPPKIGILLFGSCHCVKFRVRVSLVCNND